ncbi:MAG: LptF/LptG family permease, partial [Verrucomicrobia bacterium]|nr:LptF/LptG family permease [Verrucomicrobiota bacterium]
MRNTISQNPLKVIVAKTFIRDFPGRVLYIGEKNETEMKDFWIWQLDENRNVHQVVRAKRGEFHFDEEQESLILTVYDGYYENRDRLNPDGLDKHLAGVSFKKAGIKLPLDRFLGRSTYNRKMHSLNFNDLLIERDNTLANKDMDPDERFAQVIRIQFQVQSNFALAFSVMSFTFLAIPLGIKVGRAENYANFVLALGLAFVYYLAFVIIEWLEKSPSLRPDLLIWVPNLIFQILGLYLFKRVSGR